MEVFINSADVKEDLLSQIPELTNVYDEITLDEVKAILDYLSNPVIVLKRRFSGDNVSDKFQRVAISPIKADTRNCPGAIISYEGIDSRVADVQRTHFFELQVGKRYDHKSETDGEAYEIAGRLSDIKKSENPPQLVPFAFDIGRLNEIKEKLESN